MTSAELIRRWQRGWGLAKAISPAEDLLTAEGTPMGLTVTLDVPGRYQEFMPFDAADAAELARRVATAERPSWVSVIGPDPAAALATYARFGLVQLGTDDSLMSISLAKHPVHDPSDGYRATATVVKPGEFARVVGRGARGVEVSPIHVGLPEWKDRPVGAEAVIQVSITDANGSPAAGGLMGVHGTDGIAHYISTEPDHRRRGLGSVVMSLLCRRAMDLGARTGLLVAVPMGQYLYRRLGWHDEAWFVTGALPEAE